MEISHKNSAGLTLIELLITVAVLAILIAAGVPSFRELLKNTEITAQANELLTAIHFARSEALKRARPVSICRSSDGTTCGSDWQDGWLVFVDGNAAGSTSASVGEALRAWSGPSLGMTVEGTDSQTPLPAFIRVLPSGAVDAEILPTAATFKLRPDSCSGSQGRDLVLLTTGRAAVSRAEC
jgi:type IV fimbrial biogenesis protein FimT